MAIGDTSFNTVSQASHVGWGAFLTMAFAILFHFEPSTAAFIVVGAAGIKEYGDSNGLETPAIAGNSWVDFGWWCIGVLFGIMVLHFR